MANQSNKNDNTADTDDLMGYETPTTAETAQEASQTVADPQTLINDAIKQVTVDDNGKLQYPAGMDPMLKAAVAASKSFRDTQSGFTKSRMELKEAEAEVTALREKLAETTKQSLELTPETQTELDELMYTDPKAWRAEMNKLEQQSSIVANETLDEVTKSARGTASAEFQMQERLSYLESFNGERKTPITTDMLDNDVPKRISDKLANGELTFESYLDVVSTYLDTGKVVAQAVPTQTADLTQANGASTAEASKEREAEVDYTQMTF